MSLLEPFVDIHCHLLPDIDDGASGWGESLAMARMALADGIETVIATPHQLGAFAHNDGELIRQRAAALSDYLTERDIELRVLPGADVRVEPHLPQLIAEGHVLTLADCGRHVLLELPHELCLPLERLLDDLDAADVAGVLSHPERNQALMRRPERVGVLVERGCLMQITAGSLLGSFGRRSQLISEQLLQHGWVHVVATDAHGSRSRRPLMRQAFERVAQLTDRETALELCCRNPRRIVRGEEVVAVAPTRRRGWFSWLKAG